MLRFTLAFYLSIHSAFGATSKELQQDEIKLQTMVSQMNYLFGVDVNAEKCFGKPILPQCLKMMKHLLTGHEEFEQQQYAIKIKKYILAPVYDTPVIQSHDVVNLYHKASHIHIYVSREKEVAVYSIPKMDAESSDLSLSFAKTKEDPNKYVSLCYELVKAAQFQTLNTKAFKWSLY
jgi:hypothetical protein